MADLELNQIHKGDCIKLLNRVTPGSVDLVFADPPFNIGYDYDTYHDKIDHDEYVAWSKQWMEGCVNALKPTGSFYIAIGDEYAAEIRMIGRELNLTLRSWIIWHYTFGQSVKAKFARAHAHIFYFVKDSKSFTFNDKQIRVPSARHTEYSDKRANEWGKTPDDVWNEFPRVCGTFSERQGWHGCQMPESLLMRIIRASSNPGDLVLDPFSGSGTTAVTAAKLDRQYMAFDISPDYIKQAKKRLKQVPKQIAANNGHWSPLAIDTLCSLYRETNTAGFRLFPNEVAMKCFTMLLNERLSSSYEPEEVVAMMENLDRQAKLPRLRNDRPYTTKQPTKTSRKSNPSAEEDLLPFEANG